MSSQPEEEDKQKQPHFLFRKTDVLGYEFPNLILILAVIFMVYLLCRDPTKTVSEDGSAVITSLRNEVSSLKKSLSVALASAASPSAAQGQTGNQSGGRGKFQFDY